MNICYGYIEVQIKNIDENSLLNNFMEFYNFDDNETNEDYFLSSVVHNENRSFWRFAVNSEEDFDRLLEFFIKKSNLGIYIYTEIYN